MIRGRRAGRHRHHEAAELNITAFMNLMVILVPFLLITAVFSRLAVLELYLPGSSSEPADPQEEQVFQLEITVRANQIEIGDRNQGALGIYPNTETGYDFDAVSAKLAEIKESYPEKTDASILLESDIDYATIVRVMDLVRVKQSIEDGEIVREELFVNQSVGDAPALPEGA